MKLLEMKFSFATLIALTLLSAGCGNGTEPLSALNNGDSATLPQLTVPYAISATGIINISAYSATTNDGFDFNLNGNYPITAPLKGVVTTANSSSVTIYHNARLSTVISRINASVTPGTVVNTGTQIGTASTQNGYAVHFSTILDGSVVCPYFFLTGGDSTQKKYINQNLIALGGGPCN